MTKKLLEYGKPQVLKSMLGRADPAWNLVAEMLGRKVTVPRRSAASVAFDERLKEVAARKRSLYNFRLTLQQRPTMEKLEPVISRDRKGRHGNLLYGVPLTKVITRIEKLFWSVNDRSERPD